jgi:hypothetical protein
MNTSIRSRIHLFVVVTLLTNLVLIRGEPPRRGDSSTGSLSVTRTHLINGPGWRGELHETPVSEAAPTGIFGEPVQATRRLGLAGLGLMVSVLGAIWGRYRSMRRQRRYRGRAGTAASSPRAYPGVSPHEKRRHPLARCRVRRFDYDRFYLRMLRDL